MPLGANGPEPRGWLQSLSVYLQPRLLIICSLGLASGLPRLLTLSTLSVWLVQEGIDKTSIGLFALASTPYSLKFVWAPVIDRTKIAALGGLGRRRGWAVAIQLALAAALLALGSTDPSESVSMTAALTVLVAFLSASQDIVIDAYRVEILEPDEQAAGAAMVVLGYRLGMLIAGAGALYMIAFGMSWFGVYAVMAAILIAIGGGTFLLSPEPEAPVEAETQGFVEWFVRAVVEPVRDVLSRESAWTILLFVILYKVGDAMGGVMSMPLYLELGFSPAEIASITKVVGIIAVIAGGVLGGWVMTKLGTWRGLLVCGLLQMVSNLGFTALALIGHDLSALTVVIILENVSGGMGAAALVGFLSMLCDARFAATQYALLTSLASLGRTWISSSGGKLADELSWPVYYAVTTAAAIPGLLVLGILMARGVVAEKHNAG